MVETPIKALGVGTESVNSTSAKWKRNQRAANTFPWLRLACYSRKEVKDTIGASVGLS
jgi:hypothetical protein